MAFELLSKACLRCLGLMVVDGPLDTVFAIGAKLSKKKKKKKELGSDALWLYLWTQLHLNVV